LLKVKVEDTDALRFILQDELYLLNEDKNLYASAPHIQPELQTPKPAFNYPTAEKKDFVILVNYGDHALMKEDHQVALENVLGRIGRTRGDVAILNVAIHDVITGGQILEHFSPKTIVILGKAAIPQDLAGLAFNVIEKKDAVSLLYTFSFDEMMTNTDNKRAFWEQIKSL
jgi:hypothetical protein